MATDTDIAKLALSALGTRHTITALGEDSPEGRATQLWYAVTLDGLLRSYLWNFARTHGLAGAAVKALPGTPENTASPATYTWVDTYPAPPFKYEYAYGDDNVRLRYIWPVGEPIPPSNFDQYYTELNPPVPFVVLQRGGVKYIGTNERTAMKVYTKRITDPDDWDPSFLNAMVSALAAKLAVPLTGNQALAKDLKQQAYIDLEEAKLHDANEGLTVQVHYPLPDWLLARDA